MIESINILLYIIFFVIVYVFLLLFSAIMISPRVKKYYTNIICIIKPYLYKNQKVSEILDVLVKKVFLNFITGFKILLKYLFVISDYVIKVDTFIGRSDRTIFGEPVNYSALILRKLYGENVHTLIIYTSAALVVFYFILSIF